MGWLREHRGIGPITINHYREQLSKLPSWLIAARAGGVTAARIRALVLDRASRQSASATRFMTTTLRMYLRFLGATGRCAGRGLGDAVLEIVRITTLLAARSNREIDQHLR